MPSVMDIQQAASATASGKTTPPPPSSATTTTSTDLANADPLTQATFALDKRQRNLGKRKEKLESYQEEAKKGKELHKDQKEALQKYPEVLGQIEVLKEFNEQLKKIQAEAAKNQKRLSKQATEEKRALLSQTLRQYAQIRHCIEHRPSSLNAEESTLLDQLAPAVIPVDDSSESLSRSADTVLAIYQHAPAGLVKNLTGKTPQEVRETLENLFKNVQSQQQQQRQQVEVEEIPSSSLLPTEQEQTPVQTVEEQHPQPPEEQQQQAPEQVHTLEQNINVPSPSTRLFTDYPLQFDTRNQNIPLDQLMQDTTFFSIDSNQPLDEDGVESSHDTNQFIPTITVVNSNINEQPLEHPKQDEQPGDEQWQQRGASGNRGGQFNGSANRNYQRRGGNYYHQTQRGGPRGGRYENSYGGNQRPYNDQNRGRGGYRGNRGGGGYRGYNNNNNNNGNGYPKSAQYQQNYSAAQ